ncbi:hypothetical protein FOCC_FOCC008289 [Frankliniella occidentalis]|nr:hypothetical protein FOCC_FOCC008289 [Frankliniella occidentalis]
MRNTFTVAHRGRIASWPAQALHGHVDNWQTKPILKINLRQVAGSKSHSAALPYRFVSFSLAHASLRQGLLPLAWVHCVFLVTMPVPIREETAHILSHQTNAGNMKEIRVRCTDYNTFQKLDPEQSPTSFGFGAKPQPPPSQVQEPKGHQAPQQQAHQGKVPQDTKHTQGWQTVRARTSQNKIVSMIQNSDLATPLYNKFEFLAQHCTDDRDIQVTCVKKGSQVQTKIKLSRPQKRKVKEKKQIPNNTLLPRKEITNEEILTLQSPRWEPHGDDVGDDDSNVVALLPVTVKNSKIEGLLDSGAVVCVIEYALLKRTHPEIEINKSHMTHLNAVFTAGIPDFCEQPCVFQDQESSYRNIIIAPILPWSKPLHLVASCCGGAAAEQTSLRDCGVIPIESCRGKLQPPRRNFIFKRNENDQKNNNNRTTSLTRDHGCVMSWDEGPQPQHRTNYMKRSVGELYPRELPLLPHSRTMVYERKKRGRPPAAQCDKIVPILKKLGDSLMRTVVLLHSNTVSGLLALNESHCTKPVGEPRPSGRPRRQDRQDLAHQIGLVLAAAPAVLGPWARCKVNKVSTVALADEVRQAVPFCLYAHCAVSVSRCLRISHRNR